MGIYDKNTGFDFKFAFSQNGRPSLALIVLALAVVILVLFIALSFFTARPLSFSFVDNTISSSEQAILKVGVSNVFGSTQNNVIVTVSPEDKRSISVSQPVRTISTLDSYREMTFLINPVGSPLPGNYMINISVEMNNKAFTEKAVLTITR